MIANAPLSMPFYKRGPLWQSRAEQVPLRRGERSIKMSVNGDFATTVRGSHAKLTIFPLYGLPYNRRL